ncbi:MAG: hypothetical protein HYX27_28560 [Acidobacteria bacterium]|nr:hypothetical protein [Acidobacteriota bacterium]
MPEASVPLSDLSEARSALAQLATQDALEHLEAALRSLQGLSASLRNGNRLPPAEQRALERSLLHFRAELRDAGALTAQGLAYCQEWTGMLQPSPSYQAGGGVTRTNIEPHQLSLNA